MKDKGWIKLDRKILDNPMWTCDKFTRGQAWVDLLLLTNYKDGVLVVRDHVIKVKRGQVGWSENRLASRWKWSRTKTKNFLKLLETEQQVIVDRSKSTSILTIVNYEKYQEKEQQEDNRKTTERQQEDTNKKDKKEKNIKNIHISSLEGAKNSVSILSEESTILELATSLKTDAVVVKNEVEKMTDWLKSNGKRYKDYKAFARNWIRRSLEAKNTPKKNTFVSLD